MTATDGTSSPAAPLLAKGKRTKRQRQLTLSPCSTISPCSSMENSGISTEELEERDEYMANCLILLATGHSVSTQLETAAVVSEKTTNGKCGGGMYLYECKTCSKCFPSFQALGGHRTSHKKSKPTLITTMLDVESTQLSMNSFSGVGKLTRVHECSICGSEFASGQALGGHMRRHRPVILHDQGEAKKERTNIVLSLDLNLPAPMEDYSCSQEDLPASYADDGG